MYEQKIYIQDCETDMHRQLKRSSMFRLMQSAAVAHTEQLGMGRKMTLDRGLMWIVASYYARIDRMPEYDETVTLRSWPGKTMHVLFPRYFSFADRTGKVIVSVSSYWMLMDMETRHFVSPEKYGIFVDSELCGAEIKLPSAIKAVNEGIEIPFSVPYSYIDLNGHMNNTRYFDIADDLFYRSGVDMPAVKEVCIEYKNEIRFGETMDLLSAQNGKEFLACGHNERQIFRLSYLV